MNVGINIYMYIYHGKFNFFFFLETAKVILKYFEHYNLYFNVYSKILLIKKWYN